MDDGRRENDERDHLRRLIIAQWDLQMALSALTFLSQEIPDEPAINYIELRRLRCFETTFIVSYGRAFTNSRGRYEKISTKKIGVKLSNLERTLHDEIVGFRHTIYAHSDEQFANVSVTFEKYDHPGGIYTAAFTQHFDGLMFASYLKREAAKILIGKIMEGVFRKIQDIGSRLPDRKLSLEPPLKVTEPDWSEVLSSAAYVHVLRPAESSTSGLILKSDE